MEAGLTVQVVMPNVEVVDTAVREAWRHVGALLLLLEYKRQEALDGRRGDVVPVRALNQRLWEQEEVSCSSAESVQVYSIDVPCP